MTDAHTGQCVTCEWWDADYLSDIITAQGRCRRYPPREEHDGTIYQPTYGSSKLTSARFYVGRGRQAVISLGRGLTIRTPGPSHESLPTPLSAPGSLGSWSAASPDREGR